MQTQIEARSTLETLEQRVSIRRYSAEPIADELLLQLLETARRAPTSSNTQTYSLVVVRDPARKAELAKLAGNQRHVAECPIFVACCADITRLESACALHESTLAQNLENSLVAIVDAALVGMALSLAAESVGLGTVMIGGMRNQPDQVAQVLGLPRGVFVVYGLCLGWPEKALIPPQKPRLPIDLIIHWEQYDASDPAPTLQAHDAELAAHYRGEGRNSPDDAWTGVIAEKCSQFQRPHLRATLEALGYHVD